MVRRSTRLRLRVSPGAARTELVGRHGEAWKVRVAAPPEDGRANAAVVKLLRQRLALPRGGVVLVSGHTTPDKIVELSGIDAAELDRRLEGASGG